MSGYEWTVDPSPLSRAERRAEAMFDARDAPVGNLLGGAVLWASIALLTWVRGSLTWEAAALIAAGLLGMAQFARTMYGYNRLLERYDAELRLLRGDGR